ISLVVADSYGCRDSAVKQAAVIISQPRADFYSPDTITCPRMPVHFINGSSGTGLQYVWSFGDGQHSNELNPVHYYNNTGVHTTGLSVTDQYGCKDSLHRNEYIHVSIPAA